MRWGVDPVGVERQTFKKQLLVQSLLHLICSIFVTQICVMWFSAWGSSLALFVFVSLRSFFLRSFLDVRVRAPVPCTYICYLLVVLCCVDVVSSGVCQPNKFVRRHFTVGRYFPACT